MTKEINASFDRNSRNTINNNFKELDQRINSIITNGGKIIPSTEVFDARDGEPTLFSKIKKVENEATESKAMNQNLQTQLNALVIGSGSDSSAEVQQGRGGYDLLAERLNEFSRNIYSLRRTSYGDLKGELRRGYYNSGLGTLHIGIGWYNFMIYAGATRDYYFEYSTPVTLRVVMFDTNNTFINSFLVSDGDFTIPANCTHFAVNISLPDSNPVNSTGTIFSSIDDAYKLIIKIADGISQRFETIEKEVNEQVIDVPTPISGSEKWTSLINTVKIGFYHSSTGQYYPGTGWWHFFIEDALDTRIYKLEHAETGNIRCVFFNEYGGYISSSVVTTNEEFTIPDNCVKFSINFRLEVADPDSNLHRFVNTSGFTLKGYVPDYVNRSLLGQFKDLKREFEKGSLNSKRIRILTLGNSFSQDGVRYLFELAENANMQIVVGNVYRSGESLSGHWSQISGNLSNYTYDKWTPEVQESNQTNINFNDVLTSEKWDFVILQQVSNDSGKYETFQPYLNNLISHIRSLATNPEMQIGLHMTWAYSADSTHAGFPNYNSNQLTMYNAIVDANIQALIECNIDLLIPSGTAIQNARTMPQLKSINRELTRDGYHLDYGIGRYIASLTFFDVLLSKMYNKDLFAFVDLVPTQHGGTKATAYLAKIAVKNAIINPFKITEIR